MAPIIALLVALLVASPFSGVSASQAGSGGVQLPGDPRTWQALREGGHAILIRHAIAPGGGDPSGFKLGDCSTQRNLSEEGRAQARAIGRAIRAAGVKVDRVLSSRWCRGLDTAEQLGLGPVEPFEPLDSFFSFPDRGPQAIAGMGRFVATIGRGTVVMVTHQVNITGFTGVYPASGEAVVIAPPPRDGDRPKVVGRIPFP
jgi:phosphohistidine phosphatase SixA